MLVGLTGRNASGKTTIVEWFAAKGLRSASCSDSIRSWLAEQDIAESRDALIEGGRELRRRGGSGILAEMLLEMLDSDSAVLDNIEPATGEAAMKTPLRQSRNEIFVAADHGWIILVPITRRFDIDGEQLAE